MYAFHSRSDTVSVDEPFYAHYLKLTGKEHPGRQAVLDEMPADPYIVLENLNEKAKSTDHLFIKNMGHHMLDLPLQKFVPFTNVFLIRDPGRIIMSISKIIDNLQLLDIGMGAQWNYYQKLKQLGSKNIVIDSIELLKSPTTVLQNLCEAIGISFQPSMLSWPVGPKDIDGSWAKYWYSSTHKSNGFSPYTESEYHIPEQYKELYETSISYYDKLFAKSIHLKN